MNEYGKCPYCGGKLTKDGKACFSEGLRQRYYCRTCHRTTTKPVQQVALEETRK